MVLEYQEFYFKLDNKKLVLYYNGEKVLMQDQTQLQVYYKTFLLELEVNIIIY
jgi:hypothetical protein